LSTYAEGAEDIGTFGVTCPPSRQISYIVPCGAAAGDETLRNGTSAQVYNLYWRETVGTSRLSGNAYTNRRNGNEE
jgi:hypothetical protein